MATFGNVDAGVTASNPLADIIYVGKYALSEPGNISKLSATISNQGSGNRSCYMRGVVYAADGSSGKPKTLLGATSQLAVAANAAKGWVDATFASPLSLPAGTYKLNSMVNLSSNVVIRGKSITDSNLVTSSRAGSSAILNVANTDDVEISHLGLVGPGPYDSQIIGVGMTGATGVVLHDLQIDDLAFGLKVGDGPTSYRMLVDGLVVRNSRQPLYTGYLRDSVFRNMDLQSVTGDEAKDHAIYLCQGCYDLTFECLTLSADWGWGLHLYGDSPSERLTFDDVFVDGKGTGRGVIILSGYKDITISGLTMVNLVTDYPAVQFGDCENVIIENFDIAGGDSLVYAGGWAGIPVNVTLRNGIYRGDGPLIAGDPAGVTFENVVRV